MEISQNFVAFSEYMNFKCQIDGEDFVIFCGLLRKQELYIYQSDLNVIQSLEVSKFKIQNSQRYSKFVEIGYTEY